MAIFTYIGSNNWNAYDDIHGGTVLIRTATTYQYTSTTGFKVTLHGTGFAYDSSGIPTLGSITGLDVFNGAVHVGHYAGLTTALTDYVTKSFGLTHGVTGTSALDMGGLYGLLRSGDDVINGSELNTTFLGYDGNDTIYGNGGDDWMQGGRGVDRYFGGLGLNGVFYDNDAQILHGASVNFSLTTGNILDDGYGNVETATNVQMLGGSNFADHFIGGAGAEYLYGHGGNDTIFAGAGNDYVQGGDGVDQLDGGIGVDRLSFSDVPAGFHGAVVNLAAITGPTVLDDGFGNAETAKGFEYLVGSAYGDRFTGSKGDNLLQGNDGDDSLFGGKGNDTFYGGAGNDVMYGGEGFSFFFGGKGVDSYFGGLANDYLYFTDVDATGHGVIANLAKASSQIIDDGYGNSETANGIDRVVGSNFADRLTGSSNNNQIFGGLGNDQLYAGGGTAGDQLDGGDGADFLKGAGGSDSLIGGNGTDTVTGGAGLDFFYIEGALPGDSGVDRLMDFEAGLDKIVINSHWASDLGIDATLPSQFLSGAGVVAATTAAQRLIYNSTTGNLYFDSDGTGSASAVLIATLVNHAALTSDQIGAIEMF